MTSFAGSSKIKTAEKIKETDSTTKQQFKKLPSYEKTSKKVIRCTNKSMIGYNKWNNGFVGTIFAAYSNHHNLELRPDDVWQAILSQFSIYINKNADSLRSKFVNHEGKKELTVYGNDNFQTANFGNLSKLMANEIQKNIVDPEIKNWITPNFTTTKDNDIVVASITLMSATQKYFGYKMYLKCGIPKVTLHGISDDWIKLQYKVQGLIQFDNDESLMTEWVEMLNPIMQEFINSYNGNSNIDFWDRVCHHTPTGSGPSYLSGWLSAFCVFNEEGEWQGERENKKTVRMMKGKIVIEGYNYPIIDTNNICSGIVEVPVTVIDASSGSQIVHKTHFHAGQLCGTYVDKYTLAPRSDWIMSISKK